MPSGVAGAHAGPSLPGSWGFRHGRASAVGADAGAEGRLAEVGDHHATPSLSSVRAQDVQRVDAGEQVAVHAGHFAGRAGQPDVRRPRGAARLGGRCRDLVVEPVGRAQAGHRRPAGPERGDDLVEVSQADDGLDAAGLEQVGREADPRPMRGDRTERGQEDDRPRLGGVGTVAQRLEVLRVAHRRQRAATRPAGAGARTTGSSSTNANSLTPVIGARRWAMSSARSSRAVASSASIVPSSSAASAPPARSIAVNRDHAARASSSVSDSMYQEPPAASITRARLDSSCRTDWVLRAMRRATARRTARSRRRTGRR